MQAQMPFIDEILTCKSLSIVGLAKNTGKTETLNYILRRLKNCGKQIAVTSIGIDGEGIDQVTATAKPEITIFKNMLFVTSEKHYATRQLTSEILNISEQRTALGRLVTARAQTSGKVLLSGPADTKTLQNVIAQNALFGVDITIVDGALSRMSLASPSITDAMILATGAAVSANIAQVVRNTKFVCNLISLPAVDSKTRQMLENIDKGVWAIDNNDELIDLKITSALQFGNAETRNTDFLQSAKILYVSGAVGDNFFERLRTQKNVSETTLVVRDFAKIFASPEIYNSYIKRGGKVQVLFKTKLLAITVNPVSPQGYTLNSEALQQALKNEIDVPIFDVRKIKNTAEFAEK